MSVSDPPAVFFETCDRLRVRPDDLQLARLRLYLEALLVENRRVNLTAVRDPDEAWGKHILESISLIRWMDDASSLVDIGSGGGLPGMPLAIMRPDMDIALIESTVKKARFLAGTAQAVGLSNVSVIAERAETVGRSTEHRARFNVAVARAVGSLSEILELALPLLTLGGRLLAVKGAAAGEEIEAANRALGVLRGEIASARPLLGGVDESVVVEVVKTGETPEAYPRRPGMPKKRPL